MLIPLFSVIQVIQVQISLVKSSNAFHQRTYHMHMHQTKQDKRKIDLKLPQYLRLHLFSQLKDRKVVLAEKMAQVSSPQPLQHSIYSL